MMIGKNSKTPQVSTYSFRAECRDDVLIFLALPEATSLKRITIVPDPILPDVESKWKQNSPFRKSLAHSKWVEDGHVMVEALKACALKSNDMS